MSFVALALAGLAALVHVYIFVLESLRWEQPATMRAFGLTPDQAGATRELAYNQGFYNLFLALVRAQGWPCSRSITRWARPWSSCPAPAWLPLRWCWPPVIGAR